MTVLESYLGPRAECFAPDVAQRIVAFGRSIAPKNDSLICYLREKSNEDTLFETNRTENQNFIGSLKFVCWLKARARKLLDPQGNRE
jgi:hypothetical protein